MTARSLVEVTGVAFGYRERVVFRDVSFAVAPRRAGRAVRPERRGQVDVAAPGAGAARAVGGQREAGRDAARRRCRAATSRGARRCCRRTRPPSSRSPCARRSRWAACLTWRAFSPNRPPTPTPSRARWRRPTRRRWRSGRWSSCRAASGTACTWRARWRRRRPCCCSTSRSPASISRTSCRRWTCCAPPSTAVAPPWSRCTTCRWPGGAAIGCCCSPAAACAPTRRLPRC